MLSVDAPFETGDAKYSVDGPNIVPQPEIFVSVLIPQSIQSSRINLLALVQHDADPPAPQS
jgi:hypothetical protein